MAFLVVGDANADIVAPVARLPHRGDDVAIQQLEWVSGGSAANVATGLSLLGVKAQLVARIGTDPAAEVALASAHAAGVDCSLVQRGDQPTGLCYALITPDGERTFLSFRGANAELGLPALDWATIDWLHVAGHALLAGQQRSTSVALIAAASAAHVPVSLDLCLPLVRSDPAMLRELLPALHVLFGNQEEMREFELSIDGIAETTVVEKRGASGCSVTHAGLSFQQAAFPIEAINTNGCGDAFVAAFLWAATSHFDLHTCARIANAAGAIAATRHGAASALPDRTTLLTFLQRHPATD